MQQKQYKKIFLVALIMVASFPAAYGAMASDDSNVHSGVTRPSEERSLAFQFPGVIREVTVKEGDKVKAGQALLKLDDRLDRNQLAQLEIEAKSTLKVEYAQKSLDQKKLLLDVAVELRSKQANTVKEMKEAELNHDLAFTQLKLSEEESQAAKLKVTGQQIKVNQAQLTSTIDGIVRKINVKEGEYADPQQSQRAACVVVQNDPLKVEVFLPSAVARKLTLGQELEVAYPDDTTWAKAKVTFFDPVADAGSGLRMLHLELPNPQNRESGWQVRVRVPER